MTDKAYIVANEQQEREVLEKLERDGYIWIEGRDRPTEWFPSIEISKQFPYAIVVDRNISLKLSNYFEHYEIVFDGRKESKMKISKEVYDALVEWRDYQMLYASSGRQGEHITALKLLESPAVVDDWWLDSESPIEINNRLIAIIRWLNGEDVFEVEKPKKWVVRSKETDSDGDYWYVESTNNLTYIVFYENDATKFDTKEEAESWANAHQEVVQVEVEE